MKVELVGLTQPSVTTDCHTAGELVAWAARVSNPENQNNKETASKLLKYLIKNEHWSPFEMVSIQMSITTTRDISRQIIRHRTFSFQEFSQRYADVPALQYDRQARLQDTKNRQNSVEIDKRDSRARAFKRAQEEVGMFAKQRYNEALDDGIAKEQARALLPEGLTETTLIMAGTLRSWIHYCQLRMGNGTQKEHREIAQRCWDILGGHFPDVKLALES